MGEGALEERRWGWARAGGQEMEQNGMVNTDRLTDWVTDGACSPIHARHHGRDESYGGAAGNVLQNRRGGTAHGRVYRRGRGATHDEWE